MERPQQQLNLMKSDGPMLSRVLSQYPESSLIGPGFIGGTSVKTSRTIGPWPRVARVIDHPLLGYRNHLSIIAALCHGRLDAPRVIEGSLNREQLDLRVAGGPVPALQRGGMIIPANLSAHASRKAARVLKDVVALFLFLPPCGPDLNPIEMAFSGPGRCSAVPAHVPVMTHGRRTLLYAISAPGNRAAIALPPRDMK